MKNILLIIVFIYYISNVILHADFKEQKENWLSSRSNIIEVYNKIFLLEKLAPIIKKNESCINNINNFSTLECIVTNLDEFCLNSEFNYLKMCDESVENLDFERIDYKYIKYFYIIAKDIYIDIKNKKCT